MENFAAVLTLFRQAKTQQQRRALADELRAKLNALPVQEQAEARLELKQFVLAEMKQSVSRIEAALTQQTNPV